MKTPSQPSEEPVLRIEFTFSAERPFISGNQLHRSNPRNGIRYLTSEARAQHERLSLLALQAAKAASWVMPDYCYMEMYAMNIDADGDNVAKPCCDALEKSAYYTDRRIKERRIVSMRDKGPSRILIAVQGINGKDYGYGKPSKQKVK